jgi:hypothetical protein
MRQGIQDLIRLERLHQVFRTSRTHRPNNLIRIGISRRGENNYAAIATVTNSLAGLGAVLAVVKVDHANTMLKFLQRSHNFARGDITINVIHYNGSGRPTHHGFQFLPGARIQIYAQDADTPLGIT